MKKTQVKKLNPEKRVPCPHCGEMILPGAKICRFCKSKLGKYSSNALGLKPLYWIWLASMVIFYFALFFDFGEDAFFSSGGWVTGMLLITLLVIGIGIGCFLALFVGILRVIATRRGLFYGAITTLTFISFFIVLLNIDKWTSGQTASESPRQPAQTTPRPSSTPRVTPVPKKPATQQAVPQQNEPTGEKIDCVGPDGKTFKTTLKACEEFNNAWGKPLSTPTPNPHEYIRCNISPNCGGGYKEMTRSSCDNMICCQQMDGSWELRTNGQCKYDQGEDSGTKCRRACSDKYDTSECTIKYGYGSPNWSPCFEQVVSDYDKCLDKC